jgi:hypothetical protein
MLEQLTCSMALHFGHAVPSTFAGVVSAGAAAAAQCQAGDPAIAPFVTLRDAATIPNMRRHVRLPRQCRCPWCRR